MPPANPKKPADVSAANKEKNEYIPSFISQKPFYVDDSIEESSDYLEHQRLQKAAAETKWYDRGRRAGPAATKYRKGACENCGAMTHKAKDCLERPRKQGAKWTGRDIQADEIIQEVKLGWEAKRDRWNGFDSSEYATVIDEYNQLEEMKKLASGEKSEQRAAEGEEDGNLDEGAKYEEETDMGRQQSTATRNLRLREDTAKYLVNLDLDSAKYDPKTRSMVDSGATLDEAAALVAEEGFMKASGDAAEFERAQKYAWESQEKGSKNRIHLQANPTSGEILRKKETQEAEARKSAQRKALVEKYGSQDDVQDSASKKVAIVESDRYVEYDEHGGIKGAPKVKAKSKYPEDIFTNNHTSVWGSWWSDFKWGYACCHSFVKNSYCTGDDGKKAMEEASRLKIGVRLNEVGQENKEDSVDQVLDQTTSKDVASKKRPFESSMGTGISEEEMDDYRRKRRQAADPMAAMLRRDGLSAQ